MKHLPFLYLVILYNMINSRLYFVQYMDFIVDETVYHVTLQNCSLYDFLKKPGVKYVYSYDNEHTVGLII